MLTIRDALESDVFNGARLVAGERCLENLITSVTVLEATCDEVTRWIKEQELFLTSFFSIAEDVNQQLRIVKVLAERKCAGLVIFSIGYWMKEISPLVVDLSEKLGVPLIIMPPERTFHEVLMKIMGELLDTQSEILELALQVQKLLYQQLMRHKNQRDLLRTLGESLKKRVVFFDCDNQKAFSQGCNDIDIDRISKLFQEKAVVDQMTFGRSYFVEDIMLFPVISFGSYYGTILILGVTKAERKKMDLVVSHAVLGVMLVCTKNKKIVRTNVAEVKDFLNGIFGNKFTSENEIYDAANSAGVDLIGKHYVLWLSLDDEENKDQLDYLFSIIKPVLFRDNTLNELFVADEGIVVFVYSRDESKGELRLKCLCNEIFKEVRRSGRVKFYLGASDYFAELIDICKAYEQAVQAMVIGKKLFGEDGYISYSDLGIYSVLYDLCDTSTFYRKVHQDIDKIAVLDEKNNTDYLDTFKLIMQSDGNIDELAHQANIHKNTLFYRKKRIIEIIGYNPFIMPHKLSFQSYFYMQNLKD